jgi:hypothetical protein
MPCVAEAWRSAHAGYTRPPAPTRALINLVYDTLLRLGARRDANAFLGSWPYVRVSVYPRVCFFFRRLFITPNLRMKTCDRNQQQNAVTGDFTKSTGKATDLAAAKKTRRQASPKAREAAVSPKQRATDAFEAAVIAARERADSKGAPPPHRKGTWVLLEKTESGTVEGGRVARDMRRKPNVTFYDCPGTIDPWTLAGAPTHCAVVMASWFRAMPAGGTHTAFFKKGKEYTYPNEHCELNLDDVDQLNYACWCWESRPAQKTTRIHFFAMSKRPKTGSAWHKFFAKINGTAMARRYIRPWQRATTEAVAFVKGSDDPAAAKPVNPTFSQYVPRRRSHLVR